MEQRYIANDIPLQELPCAPLELLHSTLGEIILSTPPRQHYSRHHLGGLFSGSIGLAYLFLRISEAHPNLDVCGRDPRSWAAAYLEGDRGRLILERGKCGLASEKLSFEAVRACVTRDSADVAEFLSNVPAVIAPPSAAGDDPFPSELAYGRAGTLYMLRMVRYWVPESAGLLESSISRIVERIMAADDDGAGNWLWHGKRYFGAAHGDIGIITQVVLSEPGWAPQLRERLQGLLDLQLLDGNWPSSERSLLQGHGASLVQWCHGAPGFIFSLEALRPFFPEMEGAFDDVLGRGRELIERHGLLTKEPSLCHGIFGNALALPIGPTRDHFLAIATETNVDQARRHDARLFQPANYDKKGAVLTNYLPSAAWAWAVCEEPAPTLIMYTDV